MKIQSRYINENVENNVGSILLSPRTEWKPLLETITRYETRVPKVLRRSDDWRLAMGGGVDEVRSGDISVAYKRFEVMHFGVFPFRTCRKDQFKFILVLLCL